VPGGAAPGRLPAANAEPRCRGPLLAALPAVLAYQFAPRTFIVGLLAGSLVE
jgi:hypothetical protein